MEDDPFNELWREGNDAHCGGVPISANPYNASTQTLQYDAWHAGWSDAADPQEDADGTELN